MTEENTVQPAPESAAVPIDPVGIRCATIRASAAREVLLAAGFARAKEFTEAELCRVHSRLARSPFLRSPTAKNELHAFAARRARAKVTHPGKRFR